MTPDNSKLPGYVAVFLLFISGASGIALLVKAWIFKVPEATANILWFLFVGAAVVGLLLNPAASQNEQIFLGLLGAVSGLSLFIGAILNIAHKTGIVTLFSLFVICLGSMLVLYFWPHFHLQLLPHQ